MDIAEAHKLALEKMAEFSGQESPKIFNIGTGRGVSVREMAERVSDILNKIIPMEIGSRREGDGAITVADSSKLKDELGFEFRHSDLENIVKSAWEQKISSR
jgi:UDP-glucose 4-epimerase